MSKINVDEKYHKEFGKKVLHAIPSLNPYVKHRLYLAETVGIIPRKMYQANGIIDDAISKLYEDYEGWINDDNKIKLKLFSLVNNKLDELYKKEDFHKNTLSINKILEKEMEQLDETFEIDLDQDLLMKDELDDISYHQHDDNFVYLYEDAEKNIIRSMEIDDDRKNLTEERRRALNKVYNWLPFEISNIADLFIFGNLSYNEIAQIKGIDTLEVQNIIQNVRKSFRKNLN
ncbi:hypothetical protein ABN763_16580 [Spongiivirga sp. MCCC 1A20706]|uniref:hypothetical protein n=1 Tax=Spongiivirga sp. MCCC 1A20706 TaxID=3160963 RepID=UPI003977D825